MNKHWIAHIISVAVIVTLLAITLQPTSSKIDDRGTRILESENEALKSRILTYTQKSDSLKSEIDSLRSVEVKPKYIIRYETINNLDSSSAYDSVLSILDSYEPELE